VKFENSDIRFVSQDACNVLKTESVPLLRSIAFVVQSHGYRFIPVMALEFVEYTLHQGCALFVNDRATYDSRSFVSLLSLNDLSVIAVWRPENQVSLLRSLL